MKDETINEYLPSIEFKIKIAKTFSVTVKGWCSTNSIDGLKWHWNVYANIFESHPLFNDIDKAMNLPLHGGCTYDQLTTSVPATGIIYDWQKETKTLKLGSDYAHLHDDYDNHPSAFDFIPYNVLNDAKELAEALEVQS